MTAVGPHAAQPPAVAGLPRKEAAGALILVHGRGGSAEDILGLAGTIGRQDLIVIAPRAAGHKYLRAEIAIAAPVTAQPMPSRKSRKPRLVTGSLLVISLNVRPAPPQVRA